MRKISIFALLLCIVLSCLGVSTYAAPANLALDAVPDASSSYSDEWDIDFINDGDNETSWAGMSEDTPWVSLKLKDKSKVNKIVMYYRPAGADPAADYIFEMNIEFDGKIVYTVVDFPKDSHETPVEVVLPEAIEVKEVKFDIIDGLQNPGFSEIELYNDPSAKPSATNTPEKTAEPTVTPDKTPIITSATTNRPTQTPEATKTPSKDTQKPDATIKPDNNNDNNLIIYVAAGAGALIIIGGIVVFIIKKK